MNIGIFGGTFDPVHCGHLALAEAALRTFPIERVVLVPGAATPFKRDADTAPAADRLAMARLAVAGHPRLDVSPVEVERGGVSYTVDTLEALRAEHPDWSPWLLVGSDTLPSFGSWHRVRDILALAEVGVLVRPGAPVPAGGIPGLSATASARVLSHVADGGCPDISSTDIRLRALRGESLAGLVPDTVADYMRRRGLYGLGGR